MKDELVSLEEGARKNKDKGDKLKEVIKELEISTERYKKEYENLTAHKKQLETDLETVQSKVDRSVNLLKSLSNEQTRWEASSESFKTQMSTIIGDVVLSSAFIAYAGYFDQAMRNTHFNTWISHLQSANLKYNEDLARIEYL